MAYDDTKEFDDVTVLNKTQKALFCDIEYDEYCIPFSQIATESELTETSSKGDEGILVITGWLARKLELGE